MRVLWLPSCVVALAACGAFSSADPGGTSGTSGTSGTTADPGVTCRDLTCGPGTFCCDNHGPVSCVPSASSCVGFKISCDDTADCAAQGKTGHVCCAQTSNSQVTGASCVPSCMADELQLCNPLATDCAATAGCRAFDRYNGCQ